MKIQEGSNEFRGSSFKKSDKDSMLSPYVNLNNFLESNTISDNEHIPSVSTYSKAIRISEVLEQH